MTAGPQATSSAALAAAIEANLIAQFAAFQACARVERYVTRELEWLITGVPDPFWNGVVSSRLPPGTADARIAATVTHFDARGVPMFWYVGPWAQPADLGSRLTAHGLALEEHAPGMSVSLDCLPVALPAPPGTLIAEVVDDAGAGAWAAVVASETAAPDASVAPLRELACSTLSGRQGPWRHYVGVLEGKAVVAASVFLHAQTAGLHHLVVAPPARRQGLGAALTLTALQAARAEGCTLGVLVSSPMGRGLYPRLGFETRCTFDVYLRRRPTDRD